MVNDIIDGKYQIISKIGSGGTSVVYKANRLADNKIVAIKIVREELDNNRENERRFHLEAQALYKMSHRNIRRILGIGQWNDSLYMVTEFIDGKTLKDIIAEGTLNTKRALDYALQIAAGIEHAHRKDIIHRDIKPQNVIVSNDGTVKIVDFGIARMTSQTTRTMAGKDVVGSVHYLSPEQAKGAETDNRSDIYSFGILLYEMFTGKVPFEGTEAVSIAMRHVNQIPEPPQSVNPEITSGINDIIVKCIQKDPENRYQTATELREDLLLYVANPEGFSVVKAENLLGRDKIPDENEGFIQEESKVPQYVVSENENTKSEKRRSGKRQAEKRRIKKYMLVALCLVLFAILFALSVKIIPLMFKNEKIYSQNTVPDIKGYSKDEATSLLTQAQFSKFDYVYEESNEIKNGAVIKTEPEAGSFIKVNTEIVLYISKGAQRIPVTNTVGKNISEAEMILKEQGFNVKISYDEKSEQPNGIVISQSNISGTAKVGDTITLTVSKKTTMAKLVVPDLKGLKNLDDAKNAITSAGFTVGNIKEKAVSDENLAGVSWQSIEANKEYIYAANSTPPSMQIDIEINVVKKLYKCVYEYDTPEGELKNFNLVIYDMNGEQLDEKKFSSTNKVVYEFLGEENKSFVFELYVDNQLVDKKTMVAEK